MKINNKKLIILGGSGLIGKSIIKLFLNNGVNVINLDIKKSNFKSKKYQYIKFNCKEFDLINLNLDKVIKKYGAPDFFINASYPHSKDWIDNNFENISLDSLRENIESFLSSTTWIANYVAKKMKKEKKNGSIIFIGSIYGKVAQNKNIYKKTKMRENYSYSIIKGGIDSATRQMASFYGKYNIRVNNLCPGALNSHVAGLAKKQNKNFVKNFIDINPIKRLGTSSDVANVALFLSSDLSSYITGQSIYVDGGYTII